jgi:hypothetical protein
MKSIVLRCAQCDIQVSKLLAPFTDLALLDHEDKQALLHEGFHMMSASFLDAGNDWSTITREEIILNLNDVLNSKPGGRRNGCCGVDGLAGINTFCQNGHPLGTEKSDCWMPHFIHILLANIHLETGAEI